MEAKRFLDVLDRHLKDHKYKAGDEYSIADMAIWPWYGGLAQGTQYDAGEFLRGQDYVHVIRWTKMIAERPAVKRGRMVNRTSGDPAQRLHERHSASDFDTKTEDKSSKSCEVQLRARCSTISGPHQKAVVIAGPMTCGRFECPPCLDRTARLFHDCGNLVGAGDRSTGEMLHELGSTTDLLGAGRVALLRLFALPDCDREELIGGAIKEQVDSYEPFSLEGADVLRPLGNGRVS
jgi:hypothetical protein